MAILSIKTLKMHNRNISVTLVTNIKISMTDVDCLCEEKDFLVVLDLKDINNRDVKVNINNFVDYEKTLYIDCDTYIVKDINIVFDMLDFFDLAIRLNPRPQIATNKGEKGILNKRFQIMEVPHWNSGVIAFKKDIKVENFFTCWRNSFINSDSVFDQVALTQALFSSDLKVLSLTDEWNYNPGLSYYWGRVKGKRIIHYTNRLSYAIIEEISGIKIRKKINEVNFLSYSKKKWSVRKNKIGIFQFYLLRASWFLRKEYELKILRAGVQR